MLGQNLYKKIHPDDILHDTYNYKLTNITYIYKTHNIKHNYFYIWPDKKRQFHCKHTNAIFYSIEQDHTHYILSGINLYFKISSSEKLAGKKIHKFFIWNILNYE